MLLGTGREWTYFLEALGYEEAGDAGPYYYDVKAFWHF